jgi:hypothetical protein
MADVDKLLRQYIKRFESGGAADPTDLLSKTEGKDRAKLSALIEGYLERAAPAQEWDAKAFEGSVAERAVARLAESWSAQSGELPTELVKLRNEKKITRAELVKKLAERLGVPTMQEKVAFYYHRMERGLLPTSNVSSKVFDALGSLLGTTADSLRELGVRSAEAPGMPSPETLYARTAPPPPEEYAERGPPPDLADRAPAEAPDEVDLLFTGGD